MKLVSFIFLVVLVLGCSKSTDSEPENTDTIVITVSNFTITIPENLQAGDIIGTINASVSNGSISFSITEQSPSNAVAIDASSGELRVNNAEAFDYEANSTISGTVKVSLGNEFETASFTITLEDIYENIFEGDVTLTTQEEVNAFGANNYTEITGTLEIFENIFIGATINDLTPLQGLQKIGNRLRIFETSITSLNGLENLQSLNSIFLLDNNLIEDISALGQITEVPFSILISGSPNLSSFQGLHNIASIGAGLYIFDTSTTTLDDFSNLNFLEGGINLIDNLLLNDLSGLSNLQGDVSPISIGGSPQLTSLEGLNNIGPNLSYSISIGGIENLTDISALSNIEEVNGLGISGLQNIETLQGLQNLTKIRDYLGIAKNEVLSDISVLCNVSFENINYIDIKENPLIESLECLHNLQTVEQNVLIFDMNIENLQGFENLKNVGKNLIFRDNVNLSDFCALNTIAQNNGVPNFDTEDNAYNPTLEDIANGDCSL